MDYKIEDLNKISRELYGCDYNSVHMTSFLELRGSWRNVSKWNERVWLYTDWISGDRSHKWII